MISVLMHWITVHTRVGVLVLQLQFICICFITESCMRPVHLHNRLFYATEI
jgi:hypothetical protein